MADDGIYRKTEKGRNEIATRANKLGLRERTMLIMVGQKTSRSDLLSRSAHPSTGDILDSLLAQGFIEIDPDEVAAPAAPAAAPVVAKAPAAAVAGAPAVEVSLQSASRYACQALITYLGPSADDLTAMVEKSKSSAELAATLEKCRGIISSLAGKSKGEAFWAGVSARLPRA